MMTVNCTLSEDAEMGATYDIFIRLSYSDTEGNSIGYFDNDPISVPVIIPVIRSDVEVIAISTGKIMPGSTFTIMATVMNTGDVSVSGLDVLLCNEANMIDVPHPVQAVDTLAPGESTTISFECTAFESMNYGSRCCLTFRTSYKDEDGNRVTFMDSEGSQLDIMSAPEPKDSGMEDSISSSGFFIFLGIVIAVILFCLTILSSLFIYLKFRPYSEPGSDGKKNKEQRKRDDKEIDNLLQKKEGSGPFGLDDSMLDQAQIGTAQQTSQFTPPAQQNTLPSQTPPPAIEYQAPPLVQSTQPPQQPSQPQGQVSQGYVSPEDELSGLFDDPSESSPN